MAITKNTILDKIEVVGKQRSVLLRYKTNIIEDGKLISSHYQRKSFIPGHINNNDEFVDTDISNEDEEVKAICAISWTEEVKNNFRQHLIDTKSPE